MASLCHLQLHNNFYEKIIINIIEKDNSQILN
jgi:hypothetical protein